MWAVAIGIGLLAFGQVFAEGETMTGDPNPLAAWERADIIRGIYAIVEIPLWLGVLLTSMGALAFRYRRSRGVERLQLRWFLLVAALMVATLLLAAAIPVIAPAGDVVGPLLFGTIPVTVAVAILRHRLFDLDLLINRTLVYAALSATLGAVYVALVIALQGLLSGLAGGEGLAVAASTLAVAALFQPVRRRIQRGVDRRFYRSKYDAQRTLDAFSSTLRDEVDLSRLTDELRGVVADTLQPARVSVWLRDVGRQA